MVLPPANIVRHQGLPDNLLLKPMTEAFRHRLSSMPRKQRVELCLANPALFGEYYIKPFTKKWTTETADHQYYMLEMMLRHKNLVVHVPIEHAKSTWFSIVVPLWFIYRDRNTQGCIISNTGRQAQAYLGVIKWHISNNPRLQADFGNQVSPDSDQKWTDEEIFVCRDPMQRSKDPTIRAIGTGGAVLGARLDWVVCDDIIDLSNSQTEHMREKVRQWYLETIDSRVHDGGRRIILGTLQHKEDLLCDLSNRKKTYYYVHLAGLDQAGNALWPDWWPVERLLEKKENVGTYTWLKVIQNDRTTQSGGVFQDRWFERVYPDAVPEITSLWWAWDTAVSESTSADYTAGILAGMGVDGNVYIFGAKRGQWPPEVAKKEVTGAWESSRERFGIRVHGLLVEDTQGGRVLRSWIVKDHPGVAAVLVSHGGHDKFTRAASILSYCESKRVKIVVGEDAGEWLDNLIGELTSFTADNSHTHDDQVDALVYVLMRLFNVFPPKKAAGTAKLITGHRR